VRSVESATPREISEIAKLLASSLLLEAPLAALGPLGEVISSEDLADVLLALAQQCGEILPDAGARVLAAGDPAAHGPPVHSYSFGQVGLPLLPKQGLADAADKGLATVFILAQFAYSPGEHNEQICGAEVGR
jgi:hypothetical protein